MHFLGKGIDVEGERVKGVKVFVCDCMRIYTQAFIEEYTKDLLRSADVHRFYLVGSICVVRRARAASRGVGEVKFSSSIQCTRPLSLAWSFYGEQHDEHGTLNHE